MAKQKKATKASTGRGSPEAIRKRKAARQLNTLFGGETSAAQKLDGRTEKRRKRLISELKSEKGSKELKTLDVLTHVDELLALGETAASLKKQGVKARKSELDEGRIAAAEETQAAYKFRSGAWKFLGIPMGDDGRIARPEAAPKKKKGAPAGRKRKG